MSKISKREQKRKFEKVSLCDICYKESKKYPSGCAVLTEKIGEKSDECFAFTSDPSWEKKVNKQVMEYAKLKGKVDYKPIDYDDSVV